jgi:hypothetical protein
MKKGGIMNAETIDLADVQLITLAEACRMLPMKPAPSTLWRWRTKGVKVNGRRIKLQCVRVGARWCTTLDEFRDFIREQTAAAMARTDDDLAVKRTAETIRRLEQANLN